jgi:hypothetical protein
MMRKKSRDEKGENLRPEYNLRQLLRTGVQGKYAKRYGQGTNLVLLEPEVARAFPTDSAVNQALRLVIRLNKVSRPRRRTAART